jgi:hypothetical protein
VEDFMKKLNLLVLLGACVLLAPAMASAGNGSTGACLLQSPDAAGSLFPDGKFFGAICVDGTTEFECLEVGGGVEWFENDTCEELDVPWTWEGSCQANVPPLGDQCYILWIDGDGEEACGSQEGTWYEDDLTCGAAPVPAMPPAGMALMILMIMGGALVLLTIRGSIPSA